MSKDIFLTSFLFFFGGIQQRVYDYILVFVCLFLFLFFSSCYGHVLHLYHVMVMFS
jgi:hypothetical protein